MNLRLRFIAQQQTINRTYVTNEVNTIQRTPTRLQKQLKNFNSGQSCLGGYIFVIRHHREDSIYGDPLVSIGNLPLVIYGQLQMAKN